MKTSLASLLGSFKSLAAQGATDLAALRTRIADCHGRIAAAQGAPVDADTIERRARELVDDTIATVRARGGLLDVLASPEARFDRNTAAVSAETIRSFEIVCLLNRDVAIAALKREAIATGGDSGLKPMSGDLRTKTIEKLTAEAFSLAASEELLVRELEAAGLNPTRRNDALPEVVLAFDSELQALADA